MSKRTNVVIMDHLANTQSVCSKILLTHLGQICRYLNELYCPTLGVQKDCHGLNQVTAKHQAATCVRSLHSVWWGTKKRKKKGRAAWVKIRSVYLNTTN